MSIMVIKHGQSLLMQCGIYYFLLCADHRSCIAICAPSSLQRNPVLSNHIKVLFLDLWFSVLIWLTAQPCIVIIFCRLIFLTSKMYVYSVFSVKGIFPTVSLNFAGGVSMNLKPEDYLLQQNSIVRCLTSIFSSL